MCISACGPRIGALAFVVVLWIPAAAASPKDGGATDGAVDVVRCESAVQCREHAKRYNMGDGVKFDEGLASRYFDLGCEKGDIDSCLGLAALLSIGGPSIPRDEARALGLMQRACDAGDLHSCASVAGYYEQGSRTPGAIPKDLPKAVELYQRVCDAGNACACVNLAELYLQGRGVKKDKKRGAALRKKGYRGGCDPRE